MTIQELLDKLDALRDAAVILRDAADKLPEGANVLGADAYPDHLSGMVIALNSYMAPDIADVANALNVAVETGKFGAGEEWYFMLGDVKVSQLVPPEADDA